VRPCSESPCDLGASCAGPSRSLEGACPGAPCPRLGRRTPAPTQNTVGILRHLPSPYPDAEYALPPRRIPAFCLRSYGVKAVCVCVLRAHEGSCCDCDCRYHHLICPCLPSTVYNVKLAVENSGARFKRWLLRTGGYLLESKETGPELR
jgi:hypothetical protein